MITNEITLIHPDSQQTYEITNQWIRPWFKQNILLYTGEIIHENENIIFPITLIARLVKDIELALDERYKNIFQYDYSYDQFIIEANKLLPILREMLICSHTSNEINKESLTEDCNNIKNYCSLNWLGKTDEELTKDEEFDKISALNCIEREFGFLLVYKWTHSEGYLRLRELNRI